MESGGAAALFVNIEPDAVNGELFSDVALDEIRASRLRVFIEVTERSLTARPAELLATIERVRPAGVGVALDDVGADDRSLALIPFLRPDVVKLDLKADPGCADRAGRAHRERHQRRGRAHRRARARGGHRERRRPLPRAGRRRGPRPGLAVRPPRRRCRLSVPEPVDAHIPIVHGTPPPPGRATPFTLVSEHRPVRRGDKKLLLQLSRQLEAQAAEIGHEAVLLATFQHNEFFTEPQAARYRDLAEQLAYVGAFAGLP